MKIQVREKNSNTLTNATSGGMTMPPSVLSNKSFGQPVKPIKKQGRLLNNLFVRLSTQDKILLIKRLGILLKGGVPLLKALYMLEEQASSKATANILATLVKDVENGQYLSVSLAKYKYCFDNFSLNIIQVGEISGSLHENLGYLAEELKKKQALKRKVIGALVYPIFIMGATFGITGLLTIYVFPKILPVFQSLKFPLPWTTRTLIFISSLLINHWLVILLLGLVLIVLIYLALKIETIKYWYDRQLFRIPILGKLLQDYHLANFCRTVGILLKSDVLIIEAANIAAEAATNLAYKDQFAKISGNLSKGAKMSGQMSDNPKLFPPIIRQMVSVGENTGRLSDSLLYLSDIFEDEINELVQNLSSVIEPILMILMGIMVGFVAISIITPIYGITQNLRP